MSILQYLHETPVSKIKADLEAVGAPAIGDNGIYHWRKAGRRIPPRWVPLIADAARLNGFTVSRDEERRAIVGAAA